MCAWLAQVVRCLLINPFQEAALNDEAGKLFMEDYDEYSKKVISQHLSASPLPSCSPHVRPARQTLTETIAALTTGAHDDRDTCAAL